MDCFVHNVDGSWLWWLNPNYANTSNQKITTLQVFIKKIRRKKIEFGEIIPKSKSLRF